MNTDKLLRGSLNFMTFTTTLLMKKTPHLFDKGELVIQIDDSVIIHPWPCIWCSSMQKRLSGGGQ